MTETSQKQSGPAYSHTHPKYWIGVEAEDIPQGWMDDMVKRLFNILNRRMIRLERAQASLSDAKDPITGKPPDLNFKKENEFARLAAQMRNDLEMLRKMEMKKQTKKPKVTVNDDEERAELQREIDRIIAACNPPNPDSGTVG